MKFVSRERGYLSGPKNSVPRSAGEQKGGKDVAEKAVEGDEEEEAEEGGDEERDGEEDGDEEGQGGEEEGEASVVPSGRSIAE